MTGAEWGDRLTWGYLWYACKMEVRDKLNLTGEALNKATAKRFRDVVYRTQVVDSTMTRSQAMRDTKGLSTFTTAFMAEPTLSYNMLLDAYAVYENEVRRTGNKGKAWKKSGGIIIVNGSLSDCYAGREDVQVIDLPANDLALEAGDVRSANMVALGVLCAMTGVVRDKSIVNCLQEKFFAKPRVLECNQKAFEAGIGFVNKK